jgi:hypothetical protein
MGLFIVIVDELFLRLACCSPISPIPVLCFIQETIENEDARTIITIYQYVVNLGCSKPPATPEQLKLLPGMMKTD